MNACKIIDLSGFTNYNEVWKLQNDCVQKLIQYKKENAYTAYDHYFILCEHKPVITLGKSGNEKHLLLSEEMLKKKNIDFLKVNRGGDITFHGPGQIVGYPIFDLDKIKPDISFYIRNLEQVISQTLSFYGIKGEKSEGETGVWLDADNSSKARKICAIGVRCSRWVTMHGFALNVNTELDYFNFIVPCGISNKQVTSIEKELGKKIDENDVKQHVISSVADIFKLKMYLG